MVDGGDGGGGGGAVGLGPSTHVSAQPPKQHKPLLGQSEIKDHHIKIDLLQVYRTVDCTAVIIFLHLYLFDQDSSS